MSITNKSWGEGSSSNGPMSIETARECFKSLKTPELVTTYLVMTISTPVSLPNKPATGVDMRQTDDDFWKVFDFHFVNGKAYDHAEFEAGLPVAVITESVARMVFNSTDVVGKEFRLNHSPYRVVGVVKDVSTLATTAYAQVWIPYTSTDTPKDIWSDYMFLVVISVMSIRLILKCFV